MNAWKDIKTQLIFLAVGFGVALAGLGSLRYCDTLTTQEQLDRLSGQCRQVDSTDAQVMGPPRQVTIHVGKIEVTMHEYALAFESQGRTCTTKVSLKSGDRTGTMKVWFPKDTPQSASLENPCVEFERFTKEKKVGSPNLFLFGGIGLLLMGMAVAGSSLKNAIVLAIRGKRS